MINFDIKKDKKIEVVYQKDILIKKYSIDELCKKLKLSWINPRITDIEYLFKDSFLGECEIQILRINKKMKFEDIVKLCKQDGYETATIYHLLNFVKSVKNSYKYKSLMAPGSLCIDDFECVGCVVLSNDGKNDLKLGLGNWSGSKITGYDVLRVKKIIN